MTKAAMRELTKEQDRARRYPATEYDCCKCSLRDHNQPLCNQHYQYASYRPPMAPKYTPGEFE